ncbi:MAG TPA: hypothetical protein VI997_03015 [Candidatus Thermoplasmatota archaeon]|nr:hypothetical protein [Candidatus Thermoplasmatota archaeon]
MDLRTPDRAERRPRAVLDAEDRLVGHVAEVARDPETGRAVEILLDLTPEASEALLGKGMRHGVIAVPASEAIDAKEGVKLLQNLADLKTGWKRQADDADDA